jgi:hypothetical protein
MILDRIQALLRGRYVRLLEEEVARLRAENRALVNSLLGTAGFPPVDFPEANPQAQGLPRLRKRSWHQIQAWREAQAWRLRPDPVGTARTAADETEDSTHSRSNGPVPHS